MNLRRILTSIIGALQGALGVLAITLGCILYFNFLSARAILNVTAETLPLYLLILIVFGVFSAISGILLVFEGLGDY